VKQFLLALPALLLPLLASCTSLKTERTPGASLEGKRLFYVERHPEEDWGFHQMIADEMSMMGHKTAAGEPNHAPAGTDAIVTYDDKWSWDLSPWMYGLDIRILDAKTRSLLVKTSNRRGSLFRRNPKQMAQEALRETFGQPRKLTVWIPSKE
jgi:hypothetical protein